MTSLLNKKQVVPQIPDFLLNDGPEMKGVPVEINVTFPGDMQMLAMIPSIRTLSFQRPITKLSMPNNVCERRTLENMLYGILPQGRLLEYIDLSGNPLSERFLINFAQNAYDLKHLETFRMANVNVPAAVWPKLMVGLGVNGALECLDVSNTDLGAYSQQSISDVCRLIEDTPITTLHMCHNTFRKEG